MHRSKKSRPLMRTARSTGDRFDKLSFTIPQYIMLKAMTFGHKARQTNP
jgi:hypothetical protein